MMPTRPVSEYQGSTARLHYWLLKTAGKILIALTGNIRGIGKITNLLAKVFGKNNSVIIGHEAGFLFKVSLHDAFWIRLLFSRFCWEEEIGNFIESYHGHFETFIDCGANKGLWTCFASKFFKKVIAIEAAGSTFAELEFNTRHSDADTKLYHAAVFSSDDMEMRFLVSEAAHAGSHLEELDQQWQSRAKDQNIEKVRTVTVDTANSQGSMALIKMDVEGAEIEATRGALKSLDNGSAIIFEDHGSEKECENILFMMSQGLDVYFLETDRIEKINTIDDAIRIKIDPVRGYNFLACRPDSPLSRELPAA